MASQPRPLDRSAPTYEFVTDYNCDSNPAYGVVKSTNEAPSESGARADPVPPGNLTDAVTVSSMIAVGIICVWPVILLSVETRVAYINPQMR
jgi:hypothetical protein